MSTFAYRASLIRKINHAMDRIQSDYEMDEPWSFQAGQLDAYAHMLTLVSDMEDQ